MKRGGPGEHAWKLFASKSKKDERKTVCEKHVVFVVMHGGISVGSKNTHTYTVGTVSMCVHKTN